MGRVLAQILYSMTTCGLGMLYAKTWDVGRMFRDVGGLDVTRTMAAEKPLGTLDG